MVGVFVRLKLRLLANRLRHSEWHVVVGFLMLNLLALGAAVGGAVALSVSSQLLPEWRTEIAIVAFVIASVMWIVGPIVTAAMDDTLEPRTFEVLPLGRRQLGTGLLAAGLVGPGGVASAIGLVGGSLVAFPRSVLSVVPVLLTSALGALLAAATGRWVATALSDVMRSRRSRELVAVVFALAVGAPAILSGVLTSRDVDLVRFAESLGVLRWTPPGALGWATAAFGEGRWGEGLIGLTIGSSAVLAVLWLYGVAIRRLQLRPMGGGVKTRRGSGSRFNVAAVFAGPLGAVASKELHYAARDARLRSQFLGALIGIGAVSVVAGRSVLSGPYAPFVGVGVALIVLLPIVTNQFGIDGGAFWLYLAAAPRLGLVIRGKNLGWALVVIPLGVVVAGGASLAARDGRYLATAILTVVAVTALWLAVGNATSIMGAFPLPETNMFGNSGVGGSALLWSFAGLIVLGIVQAPPALAVGLTTYLLSPAWATVAAAGAVIYAGIIYWLSWRVVDRLLVTRTHDLLATLDA